MRTKREAYIETRPEVQRGAPVIAGTRIKVLDVAVRYEAMGMTTEEIMIALPSDIAQIHALLAYFLCTQTRAR
jgi:uncharacterized protein (DUF433 family)